MKLITLQAQSKTCRAASYNLYVLLASRTSLQSWMSERKSSRGASRIYSISLALQSFWARKVSTREPSEFSGSPDHSSSSLRILCGQPSTFLGIFSFLAKILMASLHSHTLLLYLNTAVFSLALSTSEFITTNLDPCGRWTGEHRMGWNWMQRQKLVWPMTEIDWSMPPEAVPVSLSPVITRSMKSYLLWRWGVPWLAWMAARAEQTQRAEELDTPAARGTFPSIMTSKPTKFSVGSPRTPARYPALKYFTQLLAKATSASG